MMTRASALIPRTQVLFFPSFLHTSDVIIMTVPAEPQVPTLAPKADLWEHLSSSFLPQNEFLASQAPVPSIHLGIPVSGTCSYVSHLKCPFCSPPVNHVSATRMLPPQFKSCLPWLLQGLSLSGFLQPLSPGSLSLFLIFCVIVISILLCVFLKIRNLYFISLRLPSREVCTDSWMKVQTFCLHVVQYLDSLLPHKWTTMYISRILQVRQYRC